MKTGLDLPFGVVAAIPGRHDEPDEHREHEARNQRLVAPLRPSAPRQRQKDANKGQKTEAPQRIDEISRTRGALDKDECPLDLLHFQAGGEDGKETADDRNHAGREGHLPRFRREKQGEGHDCRDRRQRHEVEGDPGETETAEREHAEGAAARQIEHTKAEGRHGQHRDQPQRAPGLRLDDQKQGQDIAEKPRPRNAAKTNQQCHQQDRAPPALTHQAGHDDGRDLH